MRSTLLAAVTATAVTALGSACDSSRPVPEAIVIGVTEDPATLFPPVASGNTDFAIINQIYLRLADIGPELNTYGTEGFVPQLAESWLFEDSLTLVMRLDQRARWHDGIPVTAADVVFTFDVYRDPAVVGAAPLLQRIESVRQRDAATVEFGFTEAYPEQFYDATFHTYILPQHLLGAVPRTALATHPLARAPVGSGRYRFGRWVPGEFLETTAVSDHFLGAAEIGRQIWKVTPDQTAMVEELLTGAIHLVRSLPVDAIDRVAAEPRVATLSYPAGFYAYMAFNFRDPESHGAGHPLFADVRIRRAVALAIDRRSAVRAVLGERGLIPAGPVSPMLWTWESGPTRIDFDTVAARRLLDEAGWRATDRDGMRSRNGRTLEFDVIVPSSGARRRMAIIIQEQLRRVGIALRIRNLDDASFNSRYSEGRFDTALGAWNQDPTPSSVLETWSSRGIGGYNFSAYRSAVFDSLATAAAGEPDRASARLLWHQAYARATSDAAAVWLYSTDRVAGVSRRLDEVTLRADIWAANLYRVRWTR